jgi:hypothetical protein
VPQDTGFPGILAKVGTRGLAGSWEAGLDRMGARVSWGFRWGTGHRVWLTLELLLSLFPGPEKSQLTSGEATVAELDGLEPDTEYTVHVRAHIAGVDGAPASVVVRTGEWAWPAAIHTSLSNPPCYAFLIAPTAHSIAAQ